MSLDGSAGEKVIMPDSYVDNEEPIECAAPSTFITPEQVELENIAMDVYERRVSTNDYVLITCEDNDESNLELRVDEEIEDVRLEQFYD